jgi:cell division protein FtsN
LLGLVIGLLLGLGIALAVAVYVTKVPVPLVDRGVQRPPSQDAVEAERNRNWNPNATLSGRPATGGAPAASAPATAPGAAPGAAPAGTVAAPAANPADPLGELIQSRTQTAAAAAPVVPLDLANAPDPFIYFVQAGAFRSPGDAEAQRARLAILGMDAKVTEREQAGQPIYRVRVGPFDRKATADEMQASLTSRGFEAALVRVQR